MHICEKGSDGRLTLESILKGNSSDANKIWSQNCFVKQRDRVKGWTRRQLEHKQWRRFRINSRRHSRFIWFEGWLRKARLIPRGSRSADFVLLMKLYEFCAADRNVPDPKELLFNRKYYMIGVLLEQERRLNMKWDKVNSWINIFTGACTHNSRKENSSSTLR